MFHHLLNSANERKKKRKNSRVRTMINDNQHLVSMSGDVREEWRLWQTEACKPSLKGAAAASRLQPSAACM